MPRDASIVVLDPHSETLIYGPEGQAAIAAATDLLAPPFSSRDQAAHADALARANVLFTGWGAPPLTAEFLDQAPRLKMVFYGAGSVRATVTPEFWARGLRITSAFRINAIPVADFSLGLILVALKRGWAQARSMQAHRGRKVKEPLPGIYRSRVGLVGLGACGRLVLDRLRPFDLQVAVVDPFLRADDAERLGVEAMDLDRLFAECDVVSLHAPWLPSTEGMIHGRHLALMKPQATFINTARGAIVREGEMIEVLRARPDLQAVLDVTWPEPPAADSPLYDLPNVVLYPHIAGSTGPECRRMGAFMVEEYHRYLRGEPLQSELTREAAERLA